jgi:MFS family permease
LVFGAFRTAGDIGFFIGPTVAGVLTDHVGILSPFYLVSGLCVLSALTAFYALHASRLSHIDDIS